MTDSNEQLIKDFEWFRSVCIKLRNTFNTYLHLYEGDDGTDDALKNAAHLFFSDLNEWLIQLIFLQIGRLTDPAYTGGRSNLSVCWIVEEVGKVGGLTPEIDDLAADLMRFRENIKLARNRVVSHADLQTFREGITLGSHSRDEAFRFFDDLQKFTDAVGIAIGVGPLDYGTQAGSGDVLDLIRVLKRCTRSD